MIAEPGIDYADVVRHFPMPVLLLTREFLIVDMSEAYLRVCGRARSQLLGRSIFAAFPDNPNEPSATGVANLSASLHKVLERGERDVMPVQRYDIEDPGSPGEYRERYWCPINVPIIGRDGQVALIIHVVEEVSDLVRTYVEARAARA